MKQWAIVGLTILGGSVVGVGCGGGGMAAPSAEGDLGTNVSALSTLTLNANTKFFVPKPDPGAVKQVADLLKSKHLVDAARITAMALTPQAVWLNGGTPQDVQKPTPVLGLSATPNTAAANIIRQRPVISPHGV